MRGSGLRAAILFEVQNGPADLRRVEANDLHLTFLARQFRTLRPAALDIGPHLCVVVELATPALGDLRDHLLGRWLGFVRPNYRRSRRNECGDEELAHADLDDRAKNSGTDSIRRSLERRQPPARGDPPRGVPIACGFG
jgi:hypothetical protein